MKKDSFYSTFKMASGMIAVLVALSLMVGGRSVHAQTEVSANASVHLDASGNSAAATVNASATPRLDAIKAHAAEVKDAARENADIHANATTSTEIRAAVSAFLAKLKTDRTAAIAELKQNVATFKTRLQNWHGKLLGANTEKKVALDAAARVRVGTALDVIIARFKGIASTMDNVSAQLADNIASIQGKTGASMDQSESLLAQADAKLSLAKDDIAAAQADINAKLDATTSKEDLKADIETAKSSLKDAYTAYKSTIKEIRVEAKAAATTSASTS